MLDKKSFGSRIKSLRLNKDLSQEEFAKPLDLTRSAVSQIETGKTFPSLESLNNIVKHYLTDFGWLMGISKETKPGNPVDNRPIVITVDTLGNENIVLVPIKAQAGYLRGLQQREYFDELPAFRLPNLGHGIYRAFEVNGHSMLVDRVGFFPGDIAVCEFVERIADIRDGFVYVIVNSAPEVDNIVLKRCLNYLDKGHLIICKSDNKDPQYPTFSLPAESIKEVWKFKIRLTRQAPEPSTLYDRINALEGEVTLLKERPTKNQPTK